MTVGQLASGMAHELGTPLNVVSGRAQMIASGESTDAEAVESAGIIVEQSKRMTQLIRQLLDFARPQRSQKALVDLESVAQKTLRLLGPIAQKRGVALTVGPGHAPLRSQVDEGKIQQALTNLIVNAIQATDSGGAVTVGLRRAPAQPPADHGGPKQEYVCLEVTDTGHGMDAQTAKRVFEPFFTTKGVGEGTGLGLSVSYGIVKEHGGWIDMRSEIGKGSAFSIYLPLEKDNVSG
jgi:signal transduction histidine kinase